MNLHKIQTFFGKFLIFLHFLKKKNFLAKMIVFFFAYNKIEFILYWQKKIFFLKTVKKLKKKHPF